MTNREKVTDWLKNAMSGSVLEQAFLSAGFAREQGSLCYCKELPEVVQEFKIVFDVGPRYEPTAIAHVLPQIVLKSPILSDRVRQMTNGDSSLVPGDTKLVLRHQLQNLAPKEHRQSGTRWFIHMEDEVPGLMARIKDFAQAWALPFLESYQHAGSLAQGHEAGDERLRLDRRLYLYIAASYLHLGQPDGALGVLEKWFGRPALRKQYGRVFQYVEGLRTA